MRDFKVAIKSLEESNKETTELFQQFDNGIFPDQPIERVYFQSGSFFEPLSTQFRQKRRSRIVAPIERQGRCRQRVCGNIIRSRRPAQCDRERS